MFAFKTTGIVFHTYHRRRKFVPADTLTSIVIFIKLFVFYLPQKKKMVKIIKLAKLAINYLMRHSMNFARQIENVLKYLRTKQLQSCKIADSF